MASQLCDLAPRSPLFQRWIYPNSSTLGGSFRFPPDLADGVLPQLPVDSPSADLLPAVYSMASGLPTYNMPGLGTSNCTATLLEASGQRGSGDPVADMRAVALQVQAGLQLCTMYEASVAEAQRCLFAMSMAASLALPPNSPPLSVQLLPTDVLPFLFRLGGSNREWPGPPCLLAAGVARDDCSAGRCRPSVPRESHLTACGAPPASLLQPPTCRCPGWRRLPRRLTTPPGRRHASCGGAS